MSTLELLGIAVGLAMDAFAVAIASSVSLRRVTGWQVFRLSVTFGLFQAMMPVLGWLAGLSVEHLIKAWDHWAAFALLAYVGGRAVVDAAWESEGRKRKREDPTRGVTLLLLAVATSVDSLAVGLSFSALRIEIVMPAAVIGVVCAAFTLIGMLAGHRLGTRFGRRMEVAGGLVLIAIGVKILVEHLT